MKKYLIIFCLLALTWTGASAQTPTKQETIDWITEKMKLQMSNEYEFVSCYNGLFRWKERVPHYGRKELKEISIDLNKVTGLSVYLNHIKLEGVGLKGSSENFIFPIQVGIDFEADPSLQERFIKAVNVLIQYNTAKGANEKF
jgi:hypothetical protein